MKAVGQPAAFPLRRRVLARISYGCRVLECPNDHREPAEGARSGPGGRSMHRVPFTPLIPWSLMGLLLVGPLPAQTPAAPKPSKPPKAAPSAAATAASTAAGGKAQVAEVAEA